MGNTEKKITVTAIITPSMRLLIVARKRIVFKDHGEHDKRNACQRRSGAYDRCADAVWNRLCEAADRSIFFLCGMDRAGCIRLTGEYY